MAATSAFIDGNRSAASADSPRNSARCTVAGTPRSLFGAVTRPLRAAAITASDVLPANGRVPYSASHAVTQKLN